MVAPLLIYGGIALASIVGPAIIDWVGNQTWNKEQADANLKMAEAADYDRRQREEAAAAGAAGANPYMAAAGTTYSGNVTTTSPGDPFAQMMPMFMLMMMLPMMQNMFKSPKVQDNDDDDW